MNKFNNLFKEFCLFEFPKFKTQPGQTGQKIFATKTLRHKYQLSVIGIGFPYESLLADDCSLLIALVPSWLNCYSFCSIFLKNIAIYATLK